MRVPTAPALPPWAVALACVLLALWLHALVGWALVQALSRGGAAAPDAAAARERAPGALAWRWHGVTVPPSESGQGGNVGPVPVPVPETETETETAAASVSAPATAPAAIATGPAPTPTAKSAATATATTTVAAAQAPAAPPEPRVPPVAWAWPPPAVLHFEVTRGPRRGTATLDWAPDGAPDGAPDRAIVGTRYRLSLRILWHDGDAPWHWHSEGRLDPLHGPRPRRFEDRRGRRGARALSIEDEDGEAPRRLRWSVHAQALAAPAGVQDRLSWLLRLAADPQAPHAAPALAVAGPAGELQDWQWHRADPHPSAWHRRPTRPFDTAVDWDPAPDGWPRTWSLSEARGPALTLQRVGDPSTSGPDLTILVRRPGDGGP